MVIENLKAVATTALTTSRTDGLMCSRGLPRGDGWWLFVLCSSCVALMMLYFQTTPCLVSDQINAKVEKITASLAQLLCSAHLDKKERLSTRTFLLYVEQHDLRFRLLRVADVGVSLPLQYVTLLVTYLIIMLQFGKLIDQHLYTT
ncbi:hypothetical protein EVAR_18896_1 [Eumeta japonica]|uniref:Gustatory receptor n=1 Tax=Eumeta variegata TaxID=151549 RepID=A0A4C1V3X0_EUMVA|nr:hypothetical protein EVAR_18896_1 [Eumeta japonica]